MILRHCWSLLLCFITLRNFVIAADPTRTLTSFENLPARLFFFDDTPNAIYHDGVAGDVYVSDNEGKSWGLAQGVPQGEALMVIEHPFNNRIAFILTADKTHYRTNDRGKTWRSFTVPVEPAMVLRPLSFHSKEDRSGYILYQGTKCERIGWGSLCRDETWYTTDAFDSEPKLLLEETSRCQFAHSSVDFKHDSPDDLIYCVAFDTSTKSGGHDLASSRLFSSKDFFDKDKKAEDLGIGKDAKGVVAFALVSKFAVVALKDLSRGNKGEMLLYVSEDAKSWAKAQFPHASSAQLRENAYTIVESTKHSLAIDVVLHDQSPIGTLFVSNSNGTYFVESLKDTNRNEMGFVDYENLYGVEGVGLANIVANAEEVEGRGADKKLRTVITFDDGSTWAPVRAPSQDSNGKSVGCDTSSPEKCSLHFHSVTSPHNFGRIFSSPAPGFVMAVGSIGASLKPYDESDTFLSTDAGVTWKMIRKDAHKYEFGDSGSILVVINDEEGVDELHYSTDEGQTWKTYDFGLKLRAKVLLTVPDSTSQKFMLIGQVSRKDQQKMNVKRYVVVYLDFAPTRNRKCGDSDFEKFYVRTAKGKECLMGHKQWYNRRKADADCYIGEKFKDPVVHADDCECTEEDFECDYNFVRNDGKCVPAGPERIPAGVCSDPSGKYLGSSGYRKIPGNTCTGGIDKAKQIEKSCKEAAPQEGEVVHQSFEFPGTIVQHAYFKDSSTILVRLHDHTIWQSSNEGYTWQQLQKDAKFLVFYHHKFANDRAYLITNSKTIFYTLNWGHDWHTFQAPTMPNSFGLQLLHFHPQSDNLIWVGDVGCENNGDNCHAEAHYSRDNGKSWNLIEKYVRNCAWVRDSEEQLDPTEILCESYRDKKGSQKDFSAIGNPIELFAGKQFYRQKTKLFDSVVGFTKFSEFIIVAELLAKQRALNLQVSLNGERFAAGRFPPSVNPDTHAYTVLESTTKAVFLHMTTSEDPYWGTLLKSNSNGTYYGLSSEYVNRDKYGFVDFEKVIGLDGIALINVVANPKEAAISGKKVLQSRITHNDGGTWKAMNPPAKDSLGREYDCKSTKCTLNIHSYTERRDPRSTFSSPSIVGVLMAVGNVGEELKPYVDSDTFLSRDAGFTWEEVHKDAHLWEFGDSGALLIMVNDEEPVDHVLFSTNEGGTWREYQFSKEKFRVSAIVTVPSDTSRKFILIGHHHGKTHSVAIHLDFTQLTTRKCILDEKNPSKDDFELWSPSEEREEQCLFGRQTLYHRRARDKDCVVGDTKLQEDKIVKNCQCTAVDFECEFNHVRNANGDCVLVKGADPLPNNDVCTGGEDYWYERTEYRKNPISSCEGGLTIDRGTAHECPGFKAHGAFFWMFMFAIPFGFTALVAYWFYRRSGMARGTIRLPGDGRSRVDDGGFIDTLASVPWFLIGLAGIAWEKTVSWVQSWSARSRNRNGYRNLAVDEDAQVLRFADED